MCRGLLAAALLGFLGTASEPMPEEITLDQFLAYPPTAEVLLLGTFHFQDAGLDSYKPEVDLDIFSERRQNELRQILDLLATRFKPTKIALEARDTRAQTMAEVEYPAYLEGRFELASSETHQIGFRLGKKLEHPRCSDRWRSAAAPIIPEPTA